MRAQAWRSVLIVGVGWLAYANSLGNGFTFDDPLVILNNPSLQDLSWKGLFFSPYPLGDLYRPVVMLSYGLNVLAHGFHPAGYHVVNVFLHLLVAVTIYWFVIGMAESSFVATAASLLFVLHPIHTEAVSGVVGRAELMAALFGMLALCAFQRHCSCEGARRWGLGLGSLLFFGIAVLAKESALALIGIFPLHRLLFSGGEHRRSDFFLHFLGSLLVLAPILALRWHVLGRLAPAGPIRFLDNPLAHVGFFPRFWTAIEILADYISLLVFPVTLSADYSHPEIGVASGPLEWRVLLSSGLVALALAGAALAYRRGEKSVTFGILFLFLDLALTANILFPIGTVKAERLLYLPSMGFCLAAGRGLKHLVERSRRWGLAVFVSVLFLYAFRTLLRNQDWANNPVLFRQTAIVSSRSAKAHFNLGVAYEKQEKWRQSELEYRRALALYPNYEEPCVAIGQAYERKGMKNGATGWYEKCRLLPPASAQARVDLGMGFLRMARTEEALKEFQTAALLDPGFSRAEVGLSLALLQAGKKEGALSVLVRAGRMAPRDQLIQTLLKEVREP